MNWDYFFRHSIFTLLLAPLISQLLFYLYPNTHQIIGLLEVYPITVIVSLIFSSPTYIISALIFRVLSHRQASILYAKGFLISTSVLGIFVTMYIVIGNMWLDFSMAYSLSSVITGIYLKLYYEKNRISYDNNSPHNKNKCSVKNRF
jgi:hypothetical protein